MAEQPNEFTGKSVDEAVAEGLNRLGLSRDAVEIEILARGSRGIFGLGSEPARVRIVPLPAQPKTGAPATPRPETPPAPPAPQPAPPVTPEPAVNVPPAVASAALAQFSAEDHDDAPARTDRAAAPASDEELAELATDMLRHMVQLMGFDATVTPSWQAPEDEQDEPYLLLDIEGNDLSALIGRRGETLAGIQYLTRLMINQRLRQWKNVIVDVDHYKERRVAQLTQLALRMADQVAQTGRAVSLEPMPPNERRIIHLTLRDHAEVYTQSSGEGERRKVHIIAKDAH